MRGGLLLVAAWCGCSGCGREAAAPPVGDGVLVLEVGGANASLRASLLARGIGVEPPHSLVPAVPSAAVDPDGAFGEPTAPVPAPEDAPRPAGSAPAAEPPTAPIPERPRFTTVELGKGETLIHLAKRHLGDGRRYAEILALNGWSDADARRLRAGQAVKIPVAPGAAR